MGFPQFQIVSEWIGYDCWFLDVRSDDNKSWLNLCSGSYDYCLEYKERIIKEWSAYGTAHSV